MIAPSEKHLEDWIATNEMPDFVPQCETYKYLVARQLPLPNGIADLIYLSGTKTCLEVVELKKGELDESAIAQVLRYQADVENMWNDYLDCRPSCFKTSHDHHMANIVSSVLVGRTISKRLLNVCQAAQIIVWVYDYIPDDDIYEFDFVSGDLTTNNAYMYSPLRSALKTMYLNYCAKSGLPTVGDFRNIDGVDL